MLTDNHIELLERDLRALAGAADPQLREAVRRRVLQSPGGAVRTVRTGLPAGWVDRRLVPVAVLATAAIALVAALIAAGSPSLTGEASAAGILRAAVEQAPSAGHVAHYSYDFTVTVDGRSMTGTSDVWTDPTASPARSAQTVRLKKGPNGRPPMLLGRFVDLGGAIIGYDAIHDTMTLPSASNAAPAIVLPNEAFDGSQVAAALQAAGSRVTALPERSIDGVAVDPIRATGILARPELQVTFYFNHATHALQGFDAASADPSYPAPSWRVRLDSAVIEPAAQAPADAFSLRGLPVTRVADRAKKDGTSPDASEIRAALAAGVITRSQASTMQSQLAAELRAFSAGKPSGLG